MRLAPFLSMFMAIVTTVVAPVFAAEEVRDLYEAEVEVADKGAELRREAFGAALLQIVVKASGSRDSAASPVIAEAMTSPDRFVQQFRYENAPLPETAGDSVQATGTAAEGERTFNLWVQFDARAVDDLIREAGLPVWGRVRPSVLVLVAVESGGRRELVSSDDQRGWAAFIQNVAATRGVPMLLPLMDLEDRARLRASDVWAGFDDNARRASQRYQSEAVLLGRVYELTPDYWEARWRLLLEDTRNEWLDQGEGLDAVLLAGVHETADRLASRYGGFTGTTAASGVQIDVTGIRSLRDYARTLKYLGSLDEVSRVDVVEVDSGNVSFRVDARGGRETVRQVIALGRTLAEEGQSDFSAGLKYRLLP